MMKGIMIDCSRNGVMTVGAVKKFADIVSKMGYNTLMLYTEDTYEVNNEPFFGHMRGRYTKAEVKELDAYCTGLGIELIPCIQTLAHLKCALKWEEYVPAHDCDDILLIGAERTLTLLRNIFATLDESFTPRKVHIGMDEAHSVGLGKYLEEHGYRDRFTLINEHLHTVCDIAAEYGFETMLWSDMFCRLALGSGQYAFQSEEDLRAIREQAALPEKTAMVYWDYYSTDYDHYNNTLKLHDAFNRKVYFAGGAWNWKGFAPDNTLGMETMLPALQACHDNHVDGWFITLWGDDGGECSSFAMLPCLMYSIEAANGNTNMDSIKERFREITGADFDTFLLLDQLNDRDKSRVYGSCKFLMYNDVFTGLHDCQCSSKDAEHYAALAKTIAAAPGKGKFAPLFDYYISVCEFMALKVDLGVRTRAAYRSNSKEAIQQLALEIYPEAIRRLQIFYKAFKGIWMAEKKPFGFDVQDIRFGGLRQRLESCAERLIDYIDGRIDSIPELDEPVMKVTPNSAGGSHWSRSITANHVSELL